MDAMTLNRRFWHRNLLVQGGNLGKARKRTFFLIKVFPDNVQPRPFALKSSLDACGLLEFTELVDFHVLHLKLNISTRSWIKLILDMPFLTLQIW